MALDTEIDMKLSLPIYLLKQQAKALARSEAIPLHEAQNRIARREGFSAWSLLARLAASKDPIAAVLDQLQPGELALLGARPLQGKTLMGLQLLQRAMAAGRAAAFFSLDMTSESVLARWQALDETGEQPIDALLLDTSDDISSATIMERLADMPSRGLVVIDYLQILDQRRSSPTLEDQVRNLRAFAKLRDIVVVFIAQIDRRFEVEGGELPTLDDVRLPNPLDLSLFDRACFLHEGTLQLATPPEPSIA